MSTKRSIEWSEPATSSGLGYHLYDDVLDDFSPADEDPPVYLRLRGVNVELRTPEGGGAEVTVTLPLAMARELGPLPEKE